MGEKVVHIPGIGKTLIPEGFGTREYIERRIAESAGREPGLYYKGARMTPEEMALPTAADVDRLRAARSA